MLFESRYDLFWLFYNTQRTQLFEPTDTVATSWWASSLLIEYTDNESPQQKLEESLRSKSCDLDRKYIFNRPGVARLAYLLVI